MNDEFFGSDAQQALLRRGRDMFAITDNDVRMTYYGRTVGVADLTPQAHGIVASLAGFQGASHYGHVPDGDVADLRQALEKKGQNTTHYARWISTDSAFQKAEQILIDHALPSDVTAITLGPDSPATGLQKLADVALACDVLPPSGAVLRGIARSARFIVAVDSNQAPVSCAGTSAICHPDHPLFGRQAWWGMLATADHRRGEKLALILGAMAMLDMRSHLGFQSFFTGVVPGNAPSEAVCRKLGLAPNGTSVVTVVDPVALPGGRLTK